MRKIKVKFDFNKKYNTIAAYVILVFAICFILVTIVFKADAYSSSINEFLKVLSPVFWGLVITYLLCPFVNRFDRFQDKITKNKLRFAPKRVISILVIMICVIALMVGIIASIIPQVVRSYMKIYTDMPLYWDNLTAYVEKLVGDNKPLYESVVKELEEGESFLMGLISRFEPKLSSILDALKAVGASAVSLLISVKDFALGMIISVYLLYNKERMLGQCKKIMYSSLKPQKCNKIIGGMRVLHNAVINFLIGKAIDSLLVGVMCFIGMTIFKMPYVLIISVFIGITNMVPFFGPFIGAIPSVFIIILSAPEKALWFVLFIFVLQQIDGNFIDPKIVGDKVGVPAFWVLFSIIVGGGLFGFAGMILSVPFFSVFYNILRSHSGKNLAKKSLPTDTESYMKADIDLSEQFINAGGITDTAQAAAQTDEVTSPEAEDETAQNVSEQSKEKKN